MNKTITVIDIFCNKCRLIPYINKNASSSQCKPSEVFLGVEVSHEASTTTGVPEETYINSQDSHTSSDSDITYEYHLSDNYIEIQFKHLAFTHKYCNMRQKTTCLNSICLETQI